MTYARRFLRHPGAPALVAGIVVVIAVAGGSLAFTGHSVGYLIAAAAIALGVINAAWAIRQHAQARRRVRQAELRYELARAARKEIDGD